MDKGFGQLEGKMDKGLGQLEGKMDEGFKEFRDALGPLQQEFWMKKGEERALERNNSNKRCASCVALPSNWGWHLRG